MASVWIQDSAAATLTPALCLRRERVQKEEARCSRPLATLRFDPAAAMAIFR